MNFPFGFEGRLSRSALVWPGGPCFRAYRLLAGSPPGLLFAGL